MSRGTVETPAGRRARTTGTGDRDARRVPSTPPSVPTPSAGRVSPGLFTGVLVVADALALSGAVLLTWWIRFGSGLIPAPLGRPDLAPYLISLAIVVPLGLAVFQEAGLYRRHRPASFARDLLGGVRASLLLGVLLAAVAFFYRDFSFSRAFLLMYVAALGPVAALTRRGARAVQGAMRDRGVGVERVGIAGDGEVGKRLADKIGARPGSGLTVVGRLCGPEWTPVEDGEALDLAALRPLRVRSFLRSHGIDRLIVADPELSHDDRLDLVEACHGAGARCEFVPDLFEVMTGRLRVEEIDGIPLVGSRLHPLGRVDRFKKRTLDIAGAAAGLLALSPLLAVIAIVVKLGSRGPVFYRQPRLGRDGREFDIFKFRSMPTDAETGTGPVRATKGDSRPTRVGRLLRRTSLDELPQLWNVLRGEMSLVGPRPERRIFVEEFRQQIPRYLERHGVKSGITGWAQVNGLRGDTSIEDRTRYDIWYGENWSAGLDLKILVLTVFRFLGQQEAY